MIAPQQPLGAGPHDPDKDHPNSLQRVDEAGELGRALRGPADLFKDLVAVLRDEVEQLVGHVRIEIQTQLREIRCELGDALVAILGLFLEALHHDRDVARMISDASLNSPSEDSKDKTADETGQKAPATGNAGSDGRKHPKRLQDPGRGGRISTKLASPDRHAKHG